MQHCNSLAERKEKVMEKKIVKCEVLLTRKCNLRCRYCRIIRDDVETERDFGKWKETLQALKILGSEINPIYGAEPLLEKDLLLKILRYSAEIDAPNTIITNGELLTEDLAKELYDAGLRSMTVSFDSLDGIFPDKHSERKTRNAEKVIEMFSKFPDMRDIEIVVTITRQNFREIPRMIREFSSRGIWTSFDLIHYDRGQHETKCPPREAIEDLLFKDEDLPALKDVLLEIKELKQKGCLLHQDPETMDILVKNLKDYSWECTEFGFLTMEADLTARPCDDWCPPELYRKYTVISLVEDGKWDEFHNLRKELRKRDKCHCLWSTHIMSEVWLRDVNVGTYIRHEYKPEVNS